MTVKLDGVLWNRKITRKNELLINYSIVENCVTCGAEIWENNRTI